MRTGTLRAGARRFQPRLESLTRVRIHAGEPDNRVRTFSTRYLTANSTLPPQAARFGRCWRRLSRLRCWASAEHVTPDRRIMGPNGRTSPFRVLDLPVSSRVASQRPPYYISMLEFFLRGHTDPATPSGRRRVVSFQSCPLLLFHCSRFLSVDQNLLRCPQWKTAPNRKLLGNDSGTSSRPLSPWASWPGCSACMFCEDRERQ
jgi:hypothetical protein